MTPIIEAAQATSRSTAPSAHTLARLIKAEEGIGQMPEADAQELQLALERQPQDGWLHLWQGLVLEAHGQFAPACEAYGRAIDRGCDHWRVGWYIARAASQMGCLEWVDAACAAVLKVAPEFWYARELPKHTRGYYAQLDQDKLIEQFFQYQPAPTQMFVEVGAFDGLHYSNVRRLHAHYGWTGLCIEPVEKNFQKLVRSYHGTGVKCVRAAVAEREGPVAIHVSSYPHLPDWGSDVASLSAEGLERWQREYGAQWTLETVPAKRLTTLLDEAGIEQFDLLSVDAEGHDLEVLRTLDFTRFHFADFAHAITTSLHPDPDLAEALRRQTATLEPQVPTPGTQDRSRTALRLGQAAPGEAILEGVPPLVDGDSVMQPRRFTEFPLSFCIITAGQRPDLLQRVLASIRAQAIPSFEIIVVGRYHPDPGILYVPAEKEAQECRRGALRNRGAAQARHEHIVFLDDDCLLAPDWFQSLASCNPAMDLLTFQMRCADGTRYWDTATVGGPRGQQILDETETGDEFVYATAGAVLVRKTVWETVPWDSQTVFGEDLTLSRECQARGFKINHHHRSCVYYADATYTSVGRVVFRREHGRTQAWVYDALAHLSPAQAHAAAEFFICQGQTAEAADCLRFGLAQYQDHRPLRQRWEELQHSLGGTLADDRWFASGDPALAALVEKHRPADLTATDDPCLAQLGFDRPLHKAIADPIFAQPEIALPIRCFGPFLAGTVEASEAIKTVLTLSDRLRLGIFHQGPYCKNWMLTVSDAARKTLVALQEAFFSIAGGITLSFGPALSLRQPVDAEYRIGCVGGESEGDPEQRVLECNCMDEVWVPSQAQLEDLARRGVERDKLVVVADLAIERLKEIEQKLIRPSLPAARHGAGNNDPLQGSEDTAHPAMQPLVAGATKGCRQDAAATRLPVRPKNKGPLPSTVRVAWEGSFLDWGSLSQVNRELTRGLEHQPRIELTRIATGQAATDIGRFPALQALVPRLKSRHPDHVQIIVRHQWPPRLGRPIAGAWVFFQPWEYGALPAGWLPAIRNAAEVWAYSDYVRRVYVDSGVPPAKVKIVPLGIDPTQFHPGAPPLPLPTSKRFKFLFVGGTIHRKGVELLLESYLKTFSAQDDVCLVIKDFGGQTFYSGQRFEAQIKATQSQTGAPETLYLTEEMGSESIPSLFTACDCLVHPYRGEGFGLPVLEAMACGLPVIVTGGGATDDFADDAHAYRLPALRKNIGPRVGDLELVHNGWLLEPDLAALAERMAWVFHHPKEAATKGRAASDYARREWTWDLAAQVAAQHLQDLAARQKTEAKALAEQRARKAAPLTLPAAATVGRLDEARRLLQEHQGPQAWNATLRALHVRPFHPEAVLLLAEIAKLAGNAPTARRCAEHAAPNGPGIQTGSAVP